MTSLHTSSHTTHTHTDAHLSVENHSSTHTNEVSLISTDETGTEDLSPKFPLFINDVKGINMKIEELKYSPPGELKHVPWIETLDLISSTAAISSKKEIPVSNDLLRESLFQEIALDQVAEGLYRLKSMNLDFTRPTDYLAEMIKSDDQMHVIRRGLTNEQKKISKNEEKRRSRMERMYKKKMGKSNSAKSQLQSEMQTKNENLRAIEHWKTQRTAERKNEASAKESSILHTLSTGGHQEGALGVASIPEKFRKESKNFQNFSEKVRKTGSSKQHRKPIAHSKNQIQSAEDSLNDFLQNLDTQGKNKAKKTPPKKPKPSHNHDFSTKRLSNSQLKKSGISNKSSARDTDLSSSFIDTYEKPKKQSKFIAKFNKANLDGDGDGTFKRVGKRRFNPYHLEGKNKGAKNFSKGRNPHSSSRKGQSFKKKGSKTHFNKTNNSAKKIKKSKR